VNLPRVVNFETPFFEPTTFDGVSAVQLLTKIEAPNPGKRIIHGIWDNVDHKGPDVRTYLTRTACRIHLIQLLPYSTCLNLNPIKRLWAVLHQYVTHNRYYPDQKQLAKAILAFMRETTPQEWTKFHDKLSDNFGVLTHDNFRVWQ
jgi:hypothetical protein